MAARVSRTNWRSAARRSWISASVSRCLERRCDNFLRHLRTRAGSRSGFLPWPCDSFSLGLAEAAFLFVVLRGLSGVAQNVNEGSDLISGSQLSMAGTLSVPRQSQSRSRIARLRNSARRRLPLHYNREMCLKLGLQYPVLEWKCRTGQEQIEREGKSHLLSAAPWLPSRVVAKVLDEVNLQFGSGRYYVKRVSTASVQDSHIPT